MYYILNEKGFFLFESNIALYENITKIKPPFEEYPKKDYDYKFNKMSEKWVAIPKSRIQIIDKAMAKRERKILRRSDYVTIGEIKILKLKGE